MSHEDATREQDEAGIDRMMDVCAARDAVIARANDWADDFDESELRSPAERWLYASILKLRALQQPAAPGAIGTPEERT